MIITKKKNKNDKHYYFGALHFSMDKNVFFPNAGSRMVA